MKTKLFVTAMILLGFLHLQAAPPVEEGKTIFTSRCAGCHTVNKVLTGPALAGVDQRRSMDWIINFVHSSQTLVKKGDKDAVAVFEKFNKIPMPDHRDLSADNIKSIVEYIKSESKSTGEDKAPFRRPGKLRPKYTPLSLATDAPVFVSFLAAVVLLVSALLIAVRIKEVQRSKTGEL